MKKFFLFILFIIVLAVIIAIIAAPKKEYDFTKIEPASQKQINHIQQGLDPKSNTVSKANSIKSSKHKQAYYVIALVTGGGLSEGQEGVWFIYGTMDEPGMIQCVDPGACNLSVYPESGSTKSGASMGSDEYQILQKYAMKNF